MSSSDDLNSMIEACDEVAPADEIVPEEINIEALVAEYRDLRASLDVKRREWQDFEAETKDKMDQISMKLREVADKMGVDSFATPAGTAYRMVKESFRVGDWPSIVAYVKATDNFQILEKRVAKLATKEIYEATGELPPGVEYSAEVEFVVRKNAKSDK